MNDHLTLLMPQDPLMALAWRDCLRWAMHDPDVLDAFLAETGVQMPVLRTVLDRLIDEVTGRNDEIAQQFLAWFNAAVWGESPAEEELTV